MQNLLKSETRLVEKRNLLYEADESGNIITYKSWLGNAVAPFYDLLMEKTVIPKTLAGDFKTHQRILQQNLVVFQQQTIIELGTGTGNAAEWLHNSNDYVGVDISPALLRRAFRKFQSAGFTNAQFYVVNVENLPFQDSRFDACLCILTLNFFENATAVLRETQRILKSGGLFYGVVPVPERNSRNSKIEGQLHSEMELQEMFAQTGYQFEPLNEQNGCLLYFRAQKN